MSLARPDRVAAAVLTLVLLLGGMPLTTGLSISGGPLAFTVNICHPVHAFDHSTDSMTSIPSERPAVPRFPAECGFRSTPRRCPRPRAADPPDPPPPRLGA